MNGATCGELIFLCIMEEIVVMKNTSKRFLKRRMWSSAHSEFIYRAGKIANDFVVSLRRDAYAKDPSTALDWQQR